VSVQVRRAQARDLDVLVPLFDAYRQFYGQPSDLPRAYAFLAERFLHGESTVFLAEDGRSTVGFVQLYPSFSSTRTAPILILNDLYVAPDARRTGAARALIATATEHAKAEGAARLILSTGVENRPAQALYEAMGWVRETRFYEYGLRLE
jgi:ribosomal protein S18 acetylase RimI-like enzyme